MFVFGLLHKCDEESQQQEKNQHDVSCRKNKGRFTSQQKSEKVSKKFVNHHKSGM
jgi:hypothetical protein